MKKLVLLIITGIFVMNGLSAGATYYHEHTAVTSNVAVNNPPGTPTIKGPTSGNAGTTYTYTISAIDPDGDQVNYCFNWSDNTGQPCIGPYASGEEVKVTHKWSQTGTYVVKVKASDINNAESDWATLSVTMPCSYNKPIPQVFELLFELFPTAFPILRQLLGY
jgi:uncharacterized protein YxeA